MTGPLAPGQRVDRFTIVQLLGVGGMAAVYGARHSTLGTPHAVKVLTLEGGDVRERLVQEGKLQARLRHRHIVAVTDVIDVDGRPGLVMEYVDGLPLDAWLYQHRPDVDEALRVFRGIAAGMQHAHEQDVVHRDLKPGNVMLALEEGGVVVPKVMDFGLAKSYARKLRPGETQSGRIMGTPAYMPPEQISDASAVDRRADVYALGCILYQLVGGRPPYMQDDFVTLFAAIAAGDHPPIGRLAPDLPPGVVDAIEGAMARDRDERVGDVAGLIQVLEGRSTLTSLTGTVGRPTRQGLAPPRPLAMDGPATLAPGTEGAIVVEEHARGELPSIDELSQPGSTHQTLDHFTDPAPEAPSPPSSRTGILAASLAGGLGVGLVSGASLMLLVGVLGIAWWSVSSSPRGAVEEDPTPAPVAAPVPRPEPPPPEPDAPEPPVPEPVPAPIASPVPKQVEEPAPVPAEEPAPTPAPEKPMASFLWAPQEGLEGVELVGAEGRRYGAGALPAGTYETRVHTVEGRDERRNTVTLEEGQVLVLVCPPAFGHCDVKDGP